MHFLYKFGPFAQNLADTKKTDEIALIGLAHKLSMFYISVPLIDQLVVISHKSLRRPKKSQFSEKVLFN